MLRTLTGLVLAVFVTAHFVNHALGVISIDAQEALLEVLAPAWQSMPGTIVLYSALIIHALLGLYALWRRKTLRMPEWEFAQLTLGLAVPLLLIPHVFGTRVAAALLETTPTYHTVIAGLWANPAAMIRQPLLVAIVWTHLMIGLHYWLRLRKAYRRRLPILYPVAVIVPLLALLGFWGAGIELRETAKSAAGCWMCCAATTLRCPRHSSMWPGCPIPHSGTARWIRCWSTDWSSRPLTVVSHLREKANS